MSIRAKISDWFWRNEIGLFFFATAYIVQLTFILLFCQSARDCGIKAIVFAASLAAAFFFVGHRARRSGRGNDEISINADSMAINIKQVTFESIREVHANKYLAFPTRLKLFLNDGKRVRVVPPEADVFKLLKVFEAKGIPVIQNIVSRKKVALKWLVLGLTLVCLVALVTFIRQRYVSFDHATRLVSDYCPSGLVAGVTVAHHFHPQHGRDYLEVTGGSFTLHQDFGHDTYGRLNMVSNGAQAAIYGYLPNSDRLQTTAFHHSGSPVMTTTRAWEFGERLTSIQNLVGTGSTPSVTSHSYLYNSVHRRTQATLEDASRWQYDYNDRKELTAGKRSWADWTPVAGQRFEYAFDNLGNRTSAASGGDVNGASLRTTTYAVNALNQYTTVTTPGYENILGVALATNSVTVNSGACDRKGEYFHREITVANSSSAVWQSVTVSSGGSSSNGGFAFPKNVANPIYDLDGNLTYDGIWTYEWNGENRLTAMYMYSGVTGFPDAQKRRLEFMQDHLGRQVRKIAAAWNGTTFTNAYTNYFVYDGWNLIAELDHQGNVLRSYTWGQDLSGGTAQDEQNAGGVGGLLLVGEHGSGTTNHFAGYDGNGNVTVLVKTDGSVSARYEYSPFGELIRSTGPHESVPLEHQVHR